MTWVPAITAVPLPTSNDATSVRPCSFPAPAPYPLRTRSPEDGYFDATLALDGSSTLNAASLVLNQTGQRSGIPHATGSSLSKSWSTRAPGTKKSSPGSGRVSLTGRSRSCRAVSEALPRATSVPPSSTKSRSFSKPSSPTPAAQWNRSG
ncbi:hypothetical protein ACFQHO_45575 [Actinomadura yumaensis]|uniref:hypothetical protein n=1 Tax=Actinomadura yumaensis TaxID=111807 RepID=UPI0036143F09